MDILSGPNEASVLNRDVSVIRGLTVFSNTQKFTAKTLKL